LEELKVLHCAQLGLVMKAQANHYHQSHGMQLLNTQFSKKEDRLQEAAKLYMRSGNFKGFCEVQFELGNYKKALAFAPQVSIEYWQELANRHAEL
jgi:hypothetical protein